MDKKIRTGEVTRATRETDIYVLTELDGLDVPK